MEVAKDVAHQQVLSAKIIGFKYETMVKLLKKNWKDVEMTKETMTNLIEHIQTVMTTLKKNSGNWSMRTVLNIEKYWGQAFYNQFHNIDKPVGSDKFSHCLKIIVK